MNIFAIENPYFMSDSFVFANVEDIGWCYVKLNYRNEIEEIGYDISHRLHGVDLDELILKSRCPEKIQEYRFKGIGTEFWAQMKNRHQRIYGHDEM